VARGTTMVQKLEWTLVQKASRLDAKDVKSETPNELRGGIGNRYPHPQPTRESGKRHKLPQRGPGWSPTKIEFYTI